MTDQTPSTVPETQHAPHTNAQQAQEQIRTKSAWVRNKLLTGLFVSLPLMATAWVLNILYSIINSRFEPLVIAFATSLRDDLAFLRWITVQKIRDGEAVYTIPGAGFCLTLMFLVALGAFTSNVMGRSFIQWFENFLQRVPLASHIYFGAKQVLESVQMFGKSGVVPFSKVVFVPYPGVPLKLVAFVTGQFKDRAGVDLCSVFIPTAPNPITGFVGVMPVADLEEANMTIEEATKYIVSAGIVTPKNLLFHANIPSTGGS